MGRSQKSQTARKLSEIEDLRKDVLEASASGLPLRLTRNEGNLVVEALVCLGECINAAAVMKLIASEVE